MLVIDKGSSDFENLIFRVLKLFFSINILLAPSQLRSQDSLPLLPQRFFEIKTDEGTAMDIDVSPKDNSIVFTLLGNIFLMESEGGVPQQLTKGMQWDAYPVFSPDGNEIAFISDRSGADNIYRMNLEGNRILPVTKDSKHNSRANIEWLPGGYAIRDQDSIYDLKSGSSKPTHSWTTGSIADSSGFYLYDYYLRSYDLKTLEIDTLMKVEEYISTRPVISPDGKFLAYVGLNDNSKIKQGKNILKVYNFENKQLLFQKEVSRYQSYFSRFNFDGDSQNLVIGYGGKIHRIHVESQKDTIIPFEAVVEMEAGPFVYHKQKLPRDHFNLKYLRFPQLNEKSKTLYFSALSKIYRYELSSGKYSEVIDAEHGQFYPVLTRDNQELIYASWNKNEQGFLWSYNLKTKRLKKLFNKPGLYKNITVDKSGRFIAFLEGKRNYRNSIELSEKASLKLFDRQKEKLIDTGIDKIPFTNKLSFEGDNLYYLQGNMGKASMDYAGINISNLEEIASQAIFKYGVTDITFSGNGNYLAYMEKNKLFLVNISGTKPPHNLSQPETELESIIVSNVGAIDPYFSPSGNLVWFNADQFYTANPEQIFKDCKNDNCTSRYLQTWSSRIDIQKPIGVSKEKIALTGGTIITMRGKEIIKNGTLLVEDGKILDIGYIEDVVIPAEFIIYPINGKTVVPGFIDMHSHHGGPPDLLVTQYSKMLADLAFGITTERDPGATNAMNGYKELAQMGTLKSPRLIPFPALTNWKFDIDSFEDARAWVLKEIQRGSLFLKIHDQWSRKQRQWLVMAANEQHLNVTVHSDVSAYYSAFEATSFIDGVTGVEHPIPVGTYYKDIRELIAYSNAWYTIAGVVEYESYYKFKDKFIGTNEWEIIEEWQSGKAKVKFLRNKEPISGKLTEAANSYTNLADISQVGGKIGIGSHGVFAGLGFHLEMWQHQEHGIPNHEVLKMATIGSAKAMGLEHVLGSLEQGKVADMVILNGDPLNNFKQTANVDFVIKNGVRYEAAELLREYYLKDKLERNNTN